MVSEGLSGNPSGEFLVFLINISWLQMEAKVLSRPYFKLMKLRAKHGVACGMKACGPAAQGKSGADKIVLPPHLYEPPVLEEMPVLVERKWRELSPSGKSEAACKGHLYSPKSLSLVLSSYWQTWHIE